MSEPIEDALTDATETTDTDQGPTDTEPDAESDVGPDAVSDPAPEPEPAPAAEAEPEPETPDPETPLTETPDPEVEEPVAPASGVLLLGSGELSRELAWAFERLGVAVSSADDSELTALIARERPRYVVAESGAVPVDALLSVAEGGDTEVLPTPRAIRLSQDREGLRRLASDELGLPTVPFWFAGSAEELTAVAEHAGYPLVVKPVTGESRDGQSVLLRPDDVEPAWQRAITAGAIPAGRVLAESVVDVDQEITLLTIRSTGPAGPSVQFCEPIGHRQVDGDVLESWQPQPLPPAALDAAKSIAARIVNSLGGRGVFAVELLVHGDDVYFADVRVRPPDSGLVTLRSQRLSAFELHARAILGLAVDTIMISPGAAELTHGVAAPADGANRRAVVAEALATSESDVLLFGGADGSDDRRRLGVSVATAPDVIVARDRARRAGAALRKLWQS